MSSVPKPNLRGGAKYGICSHLKPPYLRWDPHEVCVACTGSPKMESAMIDYVHQGVPTCRYCRQISREDRKRWIDAFRDYWGLDPWSGETAEFHEVHEGVARLAMHSTPPSDSRRASSSGTPSRRAMEDSELAPEGVSYYPQTRGYVAASVGELSSRGDSHHSSHGEARASSSLDSSLPPVESQPDLRGGPSLLSPIF